MTKTWVAADLHLGHANICKFTREDGSPLRPWDDVAEMDAEIIRRWNERVRDQDRVYVLGDCVINRRALPMLGQLKGRKCLVKGNHDIFRLSDYTPYFDDIRAYVVKKHADRKVIMSHVPIHPASLGRYGINIHGHLHYGVVMRSGPEATSIVDGRYICVSMEHTDYAPIELADACSRSKLED